MYSEYGIRLVAELRQAELRREAEIDRLAGHSRARRRWRRAPDRGAGAPVTRRVWRRRLAWLSE